MTFVAVNHVGISVSDLPAAQAFWCSALGAIDHGGWSWPVGTAPSDASLATSGTSATVALLRTETAFLELFEFASPTPSPRAAGVPGVSAVTWAVDEIAAARQRGVAAGGTLGETATQLRCPDGTLVDLVERPDGPYGLVGVEVRVADPAEFVLSELAHPADPAATYGPVAFSLTGGATAPPARPIDLGVNHVCVDVEEIAQTRDALAGVQWHHPVTESSGGIAAVCYGTTADGVVIELLESRSPEAFLSRCRLSGV